MLHVTPHGGMKAKGRGPRETLILGQERFQTGLQPGSLSF